jgi:hypothetical protein
MKQPTASTSDGDLGEMVLQSTVVATWPSGEDDRQSFISQVLDE